MLGHEKSIEIMNHKLRKMQKLKYNELVEVPKQTNIGNLETNEKEEIERRTCSYGIWRH